MATATPDISPPGPYPRHRRFSLPRVLTLAGGTFTQLVRMKVFYFMALFAVAVIAASFAFADLQTDGQLKLLKDVSLASMSLFSSWSTMRLVEWIVMPTSRSTSTSVISKFMNMKSM